MRFFIFLLPLLVCADVYYAQFEPYKSYIISSQINGKISFVADQYEGKRYSGLLLKIDDDFDKIELEIAENNYKDLKEIYDTRLEIYNKVKSLKTKSKQEKDNEKIGLLSAKINAQNAKLKVESIKDRISKKSISIKNKFIYKIFVNKGMYIAPGTKIAEVFDVTKSRLVIFVNKEDLQQLINHNATIIVNGQKGFRVDKIYKIADSQFVSNYRVELVGKSPKVFSKIAKVEIMQTKAE